MHLTGSTRNSCRSGSPASQRHAGIAEPCSSGDLRFLARLMQFPIVLISHGGVYVLVAEYELGDVGRHAVEDRVGGEEPAEVVGLEVQRLAVGAGDAGRGECAAEDAPDPVDGAVTEPATQAQAAPFADTLLLRGCKVVVASGTAERAAVLAEATRFGSVRFVVEGAAPGSPANVTALVFSTSGLRAGVASAVEAGVHAAGG